MTVSAISLIRKLSQMHLPGAAALAAPAMMFCQSSGQLIRGILKHEPGFSQGMGLSNG